MAMELALDLEDDLFYADLSRQISLLIMDEDDDQYPALAVATSPKVSLDLQAFSKAIHQPAQSFFMYAQTKERKGTGVFIPRSNEPTRRKTKHGKSNSHSKRSQKHTARDSKLVG